MPLIIAGKSIPITVRQYGFIPSVITPDNHFLGDSTIPFPVVQEDGNWFHKLPLKEIQDVKFERYNCTAYNTLAQIEAYMLKVFGIKVEYSDRFLGIVAGTEPPGNDPQTVFEAIRKFGLIPEEMLPNDDPNINSVEEYYSFKGGDEETCRQEGRRWLEKYEFFHKWVFSPDQPLEEKINNMKVAYTKSPLTFDVFAWERDGRGVYVRWGDSNHWTLGYTRDIFEKIFDSYDPSLKDVDQVFDYCKCIYIRPRLVGSQPKPKQTLWSKFLQWFYNVCRVPQHD